MFSLFFARTESRSSGSFIPLIAIALLIATTSFCGCQGKKNKKETKSDDSAETTTAISPERAAVIKGKPAIAGKPLDRASNNASGQFTELDAKTTGLDFFGKWEISQENNDAFATSFISNGVAIGDFDGDGLVDVFAARQEDGGRLFRNLGNMKFQDVTETTGISQGEMWSVGASFIDINNDGQLDLYVYGYACPNRLYINDGGKFTEQAEKYGLNYNGASVCAAFTDYDLDGDLDMYLVTNRLDGQRQKPLPDQPIMLQDANSPPRLNPLYAERFFMIFHPEKGRIPEPGGEFDHMFRNDNGKFVDVTEESNIRKIAFMGLSANWWDYNNDGFPDLYVANDFKGSDHLYRNNGPNHLGKFTFTDVLENSIPHTPWFSMGSDISDINNDGLFDYMATDMAGTNHYRDKLSMGGMSGPDSTAWFLNWPIPPQYIRNCLYLNSGTDRFLEVAFLTGLAKTDWTWTVKFDDLDNDGWEDVYLTNGMSRDWYNGDYKDQIRDQKIRKSQAFQFWKDKPTYALENRAYRNNGDLKFEDVSKDWKLDHMGVSTGAASGDLDGDGDLDLVVNGFNEPLRLYRNDVSASNSIQIKLIGSYSNGEGLGATVRLKVDDESPLQSRMISAGRGFMSSSDYTAHFGVGSATSVKNVTIHWPSGIEQSFENLETNQRYEIVEQGVPTPVKRRTRTRKETMFTSTPVLESFKHLEKEFDDFKREPLLPNKHSQLGPGMAWGDVNNDGIDDCYFGQAAGHFGKLMLGDAEGKFTSNPQAVFEKYEANEDMGAAFFDADSDGDLDLYVVSGGVECEPGDEVLRDRLYLNDGFGNFADGSERLPDIRNSGSVVAPADFDRDGDIDLFVGSRLVVGSYPTAPDSVLLVNEDGKFVDKTDNIAIGLKTGGMVTSAVWSDANDDGWLDLVISYDWGPVRLYVGGEGQLKNATEQAGLSGRLGWHNSVSAGDIDGDGDVDFVVGNCGLNTKYSATKEKPELLFYGDFEKNGKFQIVEAKYEDGRCLPRRGLGCTSDAMPTIKEKLPTYHEFAISELVEIYSQNGLEDSDRYEVNNLESGILVNTGLKDGIPQFEFKPLPRVVQASPVFGSTLTDVNGDGNMDIYVAQNFHGPQRETGNMDGGVSMLLTGDGAGNFTPVWPDQSGLVVGGDAAGVAVVDFNGDGRPDLTVSVNNEQPKAFANESKTDFVRVRLQGNDKNRSVIGSKLTITMQDGSTVVRHVSGSGSYLSQSTPDVFVAGSIKSVKVRWPNGSETTHENPEAINTLVTLQQE